jgi:two-component system, OmpR family, sensor histidine kinase KdpD
LTTDTGWIWIARHPSRPEWTEGEARLLLTVASQVSRAMERERLRHEANQAEAFRQADELKSMLLNAVSHDLRTPLASILASAESLLDDEVSWSEEARTEFAEAIAVEGRRLDRMVRHLLDLSRVERGALRLEREWIDLEALVADVISRSRGLSAEHRFLAEVPEHLSPIFVDPVVTTEILTNLVENAVVHTRAGSTIKLIGTEHADSIAIAVEDDGPGIEEQTLDHLFEAYPRPYQRSRAAGAGLGLAVASALVKAHGGTIKARNLPTRGARFAIELPAGRRAVPPTTARATG